MTGTRFRRLLALIVLGVAVRRVVRVLRGNPTRAFDRIVDRGTPPVPPDVGQQTPPEVAPSGASPDELPFAPSFADRPSPDPIAAEIGETTADPAPPPDQPTARTGAGTSDDAPSWVAPVDGSCPEGYPVKAKLRSGIFHLPGMSAYDRTTPDRCYRDGDAASADGLRVAKH